jgi:2,4-dienoyl-CoA reductase-like NADH-dependent reductase (Old Yellow Enzyme family)
LNITLYKGSIFSGWEVYGPSAIPYNDQMMKPHELSISQIEKIMEDFTMAAIRADKAGFDVIEVVYIVLISYSYRMMML